ncbi:hypothetical protein TNCV_5093401 [Trichonephila clavipes]|nr:hypothetical protein TNCV_5093401 [Trichonephila clavipes]
MSGSEIPPRPIEKSLVSKRPPVSPPIPINALWIQRHNRLSWTKGNAKICLHPPRSPTSVDYLSKARQGHHFSSKRYGTPHTANMWVGKPKV